MKQLFLLFALSTTAFGQTPSSQIPPPPSVTFDSPAPITYTVKCDIVEYSPACTSFNEMVEKNDKDIVSYVSGDYHSYVCFEKDEDNFIIVATYPPLEGLYRRLPSAPSIVQQPSRVLFIRYKQGVSDDFKFVAGVWKKGAGVGEVFVTPRASETSVSVDNAEIAVEYSFDNLNKNRTHYNFVIRRSTLRFIETWTAPSTKDKSSDQIHEGGHCAEFNPAS